MAKSKNNLIKPDFEMAMTGIIPSKQISYENKDTESLKKFREEAFKILEQSLKSNLEYSKIFPTTKGVFIFIIQYFQNESEYQKRDIDNMAKILLDSFKGGIYADDNLVEELYITKRIDKKIKDNFIYVGIKILSKDNCSSMMKCINTQRAIELYVMAMSGKAC